MAKKPGIAELRKLAESKGGKILSKEYVDAKTALTWTCSKRHVWRATPTDIKKGTWCPICAIQNKAK